MSEYYTESSSEYDDEDEFCYYCDTELMYEEDVYTDSTPCKTRYYCQSCSLHIHSSDIE